MTRSRTSFAAPSALRSGNRLAAAILSASVGAAALMMAPSAGLAQDSTYSAQDVTRHFEQLKTRSLQMTGKTRALCIGTRDECNPDGAAPAEGGQVAVTPQSDDTQTAAAPESTEGFNMLVSFEYASARLSASAMANLREFAKGISVPELDGATFLIEGHTDGIGSTDYNQRLSEDRANAVTEYLITLGVKRDRLKTVGYGESKPKVADSNDPANRRVESRIILK